MFTIKDSTNFFQLRFLNQYLKSYKCCIAGGCFKNIFNNEKIKDIDIFFEDERSWAEVTDKFRNDEVYKYHYENEKVIAFRNTETDIVVELIKYRFGKPKELIDEFDWTITKFAYYKKSVYNPITLDTTDVYEAIFHSDFFEHLLLHRLVADNKIPHPFNSFERALRYKGYGYSMCKETKEKLLTAIREAEGDVDISKSLYDGMD